MDPSQSQSSCHSTYSDLLFFCFLFLMPTTAAFVKALFHYFVYADVLKHYQDKGIPVEGRIVGKKSALVKEHRGGLYSDPYAGRGGQEFPVPPYFLQVQYTPIGCDSSVIIQKQVEASWLLYESMTAGDEVEMTQLEGCHGSAIVLDDFRTEIAGGNVGSLQSLSALWLASLGLCAWNACVAFGFTIIVVIFATIVTLVWVYLSHLSNYRERMCRPILEANEEENELLL